MVHKEKETVVYTPEMGMNLASVESGRLGGLKGSKVSADNPIPE